MQIRWNGHSSFTITADNGTVIVTDPYNSQGYGDEFTYDIVRDRADGVLISHGHKDHSYVEGLTGSPMVLKASGEIKGIQVTGIKTCHDDSGGKKRGLNMVFRFTVDNIHICFLGDLGDLLSQSQLKEIGDVDILLIPVGGFYTLDLQKAAELVRLMNPRIAIPMHFRNDKCKFSIAGVDEFTKRMQNVKRIGKSEVDISFKYLPEDGPEVWVLDHAM